MEQKFDQSLKPLSSSFEINVNLLVSYTIQSARSWSKNIYEFNRVPQITVEAYVYFIKQLKNFRPQVHTFLYLTMGFLIYFLKFAHKYYDASIHFLFCPNYYKY